MEEVNRQFFEALFEHCEGMVVTRRLPSGVADDWPVDFYANPAVFDKWLDMHREENLYFYVATRDGNGAEKKNIVEVPAVWADCDFDKTPKEEVHEAMRRFPFKPSVAVFTGGGYHLYWILDEPVGPEEIGQVEDVNRRIAAALGSDRAVCDASRLLRIPGSRNMKPGRNEALVKVLRMHNYRYDLADFEELPEAPTTTAYEGQQVATVDLYKCAFIRWCADNPADVPEPLWYAMVTNVARVYPGGISACHGLSREHSKYSASETNQKILHALDASGPHTCAWIQSHGFDGCADCAVRSPIRKIQNLSRRTGNAYKDPFDS